jgi:two-component system, NtrC family, sensor kinase
MSDASAEAAFDDPLADRVNEARLATLGLLVAGLVHEINTPLGAINSNHDVLRRALGKLQDILADEVVEPHELDEVRRIVRAVDGILHVNDMAVERMTALVANLRSFGRIDGAETEMADLHEGLDSTLAIMAHELRPISVVKAYGELPRVPCRAQQVNQVFMNLLMNARQATPDGGTITIRTARQDSHVMVQISDTGTGIPAAQLALIFEPGFTTRGGRIGMGLGLAICRQIVDRHGGRLHAASEPGRGATFTLQLPVDRRPPVEDAVQRSPARTEASHDEGNTDTR